MARYSGRSYHKCNTFGYMTTTEATEAWAASYRVKTRYEKKYQPLFYRALRAQKAPTLEVAKKDGAMAAYATIPFISSRPLELAYDKFYRAVVPHEASREYARLATTKAFGINIDWLVDVEAFLQQYMLNNIIRPMTARTMERMYRVLNQGIASGASNDEIISALDDSEVDVTRARLIARTESTRATNFATQLGADRHDFKTQKIWLSAKDWRTRGSRAEDKADHLHMHLQRADEYGVFTDPRNGVRLLFPGDSTLGMAKPKKHGFG